MYLLKTRRHLFVLAQMMLVASAFCISATASAQSWPTKPVRMIIPFPPGSSPDVVARLLAERMGKVWGQAVFVDNRPGAGGIPGMSGLARSPNDGYTIGFLPAAVITITPEIYKNPQFNVDTDFVPISPVGTTPMLIVVNGNSEYKTLDDLMAAAKAKPGSINFAAPQLNSIPHIAGELMGKGRGGSFYTVPYPTVPAAITAVLSGEAIVTVDAPPSLLPNIKAGKLRALAVTSKTRMPGFESLPAANESIKGFEAIGWFALYAPTGTPAAIVEQINRDINKIIQAPDLIARLAELGVFPKGGTAADLTSFVSEQRTLWKKIVSDMGIQPQ
jgi:tripartite-type tricarboxylate transporter receptor subunit TctC